MSENKDKKIKTIFIGTPDFSVPSLRALVQDTRFDVQMAITSPDKKVGRKQELNKPAVKMAAESLGLTIEQPMRIRDFVAEIEAIRPDLIVVIAYGQIIPQQILDIPKLGCINVHGSLLPRYRGASCVQAAIRNQDKESGITIMKMDKGLDTGPIIKTFSIEINSTDTSLSFAKKLSVLAGEVLADTLVAYAKGDLNATAQDNEKASYVGITKKEDGHIDWKQDAESIAALWRAMQPWPGIYADSKFGRLKIISTGGRHDSKKHEVGTIYPELSKLFVQCHDASLEILSIQAEGHKASDAASFINGNSKYLNTLLT